MTPHLGASTAEATDRAGFQSAEQIVAALTGGAVTTAVNIPSVGAEEMAALAPFLPLAERLGRLAMGLAQGSSVERIEATFLGRIAELDTRLLTLAVITGAMQGRTEQAVNYVNAASLSPPSAGSSSSEHSSREAQDFNELIRVAVHGRRRARRRRRHRRRPGHRRRTSPRSGTTASWSSSSATSRSSATATCPA